MSTFQKLTLGILGSVALCIMTTLTFTVWYMVTRPTPSPPPTPIAKRPELPCVVPDIAGLDEAAAEKTEFEAEGIQSIICLPIMSGENVIGYIGFDSVKCKRAWHEDMIMVLRSVGECLAGAILRSRTEESLRKSKLKYRN